MSTAQPVLGPDGEPDPLALYPTNLLCPGWCPRAHGHAFRYGLLENANGEPVKLFHRLHRLVLTDLDPEAWQLSASLSQLETTPDPTGRGRTLRRPEVTLEAPNQLVNLGDGPPADALRVLALDLLRLVDRLESDPLMPRGMTANATALDVDEQNGAGQ